MPRETALSDHDVVERARKGDQEAFRVLVERYQGRLHALAVRVLRDPEQARDAVQDAFLKAYSNLDRFEGRSSFYTWLYRLALNLCLDLRRRDHSAHRVETPEVGDLERIATVESRPADQQHWREHEDAPDEAVSRAELRERVANAIATLPDASRETLILREVEGLSYTEIAEALDIPRGTVMSRLHYARRRVQEILREAGAVEAWELGEGGARSEDTHDDESEGVKR
jgi:RNA polymerase sigma-70 factor (ECF subfamily)